MPIRHAFESLVLDAGDPDLVGPDEWNADHEVVGSGATVVGVGEDFGASPLQVPVPGGIANGDLIVFSVATVNSVPNAAGPSGSWNELVRFDTSSSEWQAVYWKIASGESGTWDITHSAGVVAVAGAAVYRGVDTLWEDEFNSASLSSPSTFGHPAGLLVIVWFAADSGTAAALVNQSSHVTEDVNVNTTSTQSVMLMIGHRDTYYEAAAGSFLATTNADPTYYGVLAAVFYEA